MKKNLGKSWNVEGSEGNPMEVTDHEYMKVGERKVREKLERRERKSVFRGF